MALTDAKIRAAKPTDKAYKLTDGAGMFLLVHPNGSRYWRLRYRILGKEKTLALGVYPEIAGIPQFDRICTLFNAFRRLNYGTD
ncbi:Arm DNA-binding domain-containing protein [Escherichia coli]|uniref:Arm DNA-binding domain-containing protein n=1 Tax=Escherichia coli TaxID=562 RepID=UPI00352E4C9D